MSRVGGPRVVCGQRGNPTMTNRRKFIAGIGALATGSAAAVGTGAFSSVRANRDIAAATIGDASAYLGLESKSDYATYDGKELELSFDNLNENAESRFYNTFWIRNNGSNDVSVQAYTLDAGGNLDGWGSSDFALYWSEDEIDESSGAFVYDAMHSVDNVDDVSGPTKDVPRLAPGEAIAVHPQFFLVGETGTGDTPAEFAFYATRTQL